MTIQSILSVAIFAPQGCSASRNRNTVGVSPDFSYRLRI
jgi:uncharacterized protein with PQ loop repeat